MTDENGSPNVEPITPTEPVVEPTAEPVTTPEPTGSPNNVVEPVKPEPVVEPATDDTVLNPVVDDSTIPKTEEELQKIKLEIEKLNIANQQKDAELKALKEKLSNPEPEVGDTPLPAEPASEGDILVKVDDLTEDQKADMLIYGNTYVDEEGKRLDPSEVVVDEGGNVKYVRNPTGW